MVPEDLLPAMNAVRPLSSNLVGSMIGPAVGGILAAFSTTLAIGVDCATFLVSASAPALMKPTPSPRRNDGTSMFDEIREGVRYVRETRWLWTTLVAVAAVNAFVFSPMAVLIPYFLLHDLHVGKLIVGYSFALSGFAGAIGALIAGRLKIPRRRIRAMWTFWTIGTFAALIIGVATNYWEVFIVAMVASPMMLLGNVVWESMMQNEVPRELLGRASSVDWFVSLGVSPIGLIVAGELRNYIGVRSYFVLMGLLTSIPGLYILLSRRINEFDRDRFSG